MGIAIAVSKGVLRSLMCSADAKVQGIPVDYAITGFIAIPFENSKLETRYVNWYTISKLGILYLLESHQP